MKSILKIDNKIVRNSRTLLTYTTLIPMGGLQLWLDAAGVVLNGNYVSQWTDKSGLENHALQSVAASQPLYITSEPTLNSKPVLRFTSSPTLINMEFITPISMNNIGYSFFVIYKLDSLGGSAIIRENNFYSAIVIGYTGDSVIFQDNIGNYVTSQELTNSLLYNSISIIGNISTYAFYEHGNLKGSGNWSPQTFLFHTISDVGNLPLNGNIAEIIIYNRALSTEERQQVELYLNTKYALY